MQHANQNQAIPNKFANLQFTSPEDVIPYLRFGLVGPTGSGKTWTALAIATAMSKRVALIDTENGTAAKYRKYFNFQHLNLTEHSPEAYRYCINLAVEQGYDTLIIDSLSHAWAGRGGALEMVDEASTRYKSNSWAAWREVTPEHNALVDSIIYANIHIIATMRTHTEWQLIENDRGKKVPTRIGLAPIQRKGLEYELDIVGDMDVDHNLIISKTRCFELDNKVIKKPDGKELAQTLINWLSATQTQYDVVEPETTNEPAIDTVAALPEESSAHSNNQTEQPQPVDTEQPQHPEPVNTTDTDEELEATDPTTIINNNDRSTTEAETDNLGDIIFDTAPQVAAAQAEPEEDMTKTATIKLIQAKGATVYENWPAQRQILVYMLTNQRTKSITRMGDNEIGLILEAVNNREAMINELHQIGESLYDDRWAAVCMTNTMKLTNNRTEKIPALTDEELDQFFQAIKNMQAKAEQQTEAAA